MSATPRRAHAPRSAARILRFDGVQRAAHWLTAALFATLVATGIPLYFGTLFGVVLDRHEVQAIHLWTGLALLVPVLVAATGPWGEPMRRDVRRFVYWSAAEVRWLRTWGKDRYRTGKFNPGQKLNAVGVAGLFVVLLVSGSMLQWFRFFSVETRSAATFVHDVGAFVVVALAVGHVAVAFAHPESLRSMVKGWVTERWAAERAPSWLAEVRDDAAPHDDAGTRRGQERSVPGRP